jgi:hypothetical protein
LPFISDGTDRRIPIRLRNDFVALELGLADLLVSPSRYLADGYLRAGFSAAQLDVIPYGIDVARFAPLRNRAVPVRPRFTFVGHFGEHKGLRILCRALAHLENARDRFDLFLVGEGQLLPAIRQEVIERGWERSVHFPGRVDHAGIDAVYRQTDVLVLPSIWPENQPVSITEAMAAGIPVIASRIGGIPEMVEDGATGFLIEAGEPAPLAAAMARFIDNPALVRDLGDAAADRIADNTVDRRVEEYIARYSAIRPAPEPRSAPVPLVACVGNRFSPICAAAVDILSRKSGAPRFVMREWIDDELLSTADVIWVVDDDVAAQEALLGTGAPLLVPAGAAALQRLCVEANCGLYYSDPEQAVACLEFLLQNGPTREALGHNASRLTSGPPSRRLR